MDDTLPAYGANPGANSPMEKAMTLATETSITTNMPTVTMRTMEKCLRELLLDDLACFIWGAPGIGKTAMVNQVGRSIPNWNVITTVLNCREPVDMTGMPQPDLKANLTRWLRPEFMPREDRDGAEGIWFIDEANTVGSAMMPVMFQLIQERMCGTHPIPKGWRIVCAGNRTKDRASAQRMPTPMRNKLAHFNVEADLDSWIDWAHKAQINPYVIAFLRFRPHFLHMMPTSDEVNTFPTPRQWEKVAKQINKPRELRQMLIGSLVGDGIAAEVEGFLSIFSKIPSVEDAIRNPKTAELPDEKMPSLCWAMATALARKATRQNFSNVIEYVSRFHTREFEVAAVIDAAKRDTTLQETSAFGTWHVRNQDILL